MPRFMRKPWVVGLAAFVQIFLLSVQTKNLQHDAILAVGITSVGISTTWFVTVNGVVHSWACRFGHVVGAALGATAAIPFYGWFV
jgi:hypothetical protein